MSSGVRRLAAAGVALLAVLVLIVGTLWIAQAFFGRSLRGFSQNYSSNGERIYRTGTSASGPRITFEMQGMGPMRGMRGRMACIDCHGANGEGGTVQMMMGSYTAPNIQYRELTEEAHADEHEEHAPYTEETLKRAITEGIGPEGEPLEWPMPRWEMTDEQLEDLIAYLKTLE